ncbi:MAG: DUF2325 domain-containing protein [Rhodocyclales bacterium]|nr:DUF2325 domain-containing protein [Rhodocyclales bacterium]
MADFPFSVARSLPAALRQAAGAYAVPSPLIEPELLPAAGSRRRRLWELPHRCHCPVVGVCFACDELRGLMRKVMHFPPETSDHVLHTTAVGACEQRSRLAELLQRTLEQRYRLTVKALAGVKTGGELRAAWRRACDEGAGVPGMLWACWTHPALDSGLEQEIFGDIHMLQHQLGTGTRADLKAMQTLRDENSHLRRQLDAANAGLDQARADKVAATQVAAREIADLRSELAVAAARGERFGRELETLRGELPERKARAELVHQLARADARADAFRQRTESLEREVARLREFARYAEETIEALGCDASDGRDDMAAADLPERRLSGKAVLCVGGRSGALHSYREVVEQCGGRFLHHDGGLEENLHRIDNAVAAADIVICQVGCISHNAYWRVKEHCKRTGKPCMFVKTPGVSSFGRAIGEAGSQEASTKPG